MADSAGRPAPKALADAAVLDRDGAPHRLREWWSDRPCVLLFLRHFGCIGCAEQITELTPRLREIAGAGARTLLVGSGAPDVIDAFVERQGLSDKDVAIVTDPSLAAFRAAGLARSVWATYGPRAVADYVRALGSGFVSRKLAGDLYQQGGALVVDAGGRVVFHRVARSLGDHADAADLVDAVLSLAARASPMRV